MGPPQNNLPPANTTQTQPGNTGPAPAGRSVGRWGRLWNSFRESFTKHIRTTIRCTPGQTSSGSREGQVAEYWGVQTGGHPAGGEAPDNSDPPGHSSSKRDQVSGITSDRPDKTGKNTERSHVAAHEQGTPELQPPAVPRPSRPTSQLVSSSANPALPSSGTSDERATEQDEQKLGQPDKNDSDSAGHRTVDDVFRENVLERDDRSYNGSSSLKSARSKDSSSTTGKPRKGRKSDDGQNGDQGTERAGEENT